MLPEIKSQTISGYVVDANTSNPLQGAVLNVFDGTKTQFVETSLDGYYSFDLSAGIFVVNCTRFGYEDFISGNIKLGYDQFYKLDIEMNPVQQYNQSINNVTPNAIQNSSNNQQAPANTNASSDVIFTIDGSEIKAYINEITQETIKYRDFNQPSGPIRNLPVEEVFMVIYKDGSKETFNKTSKKNTYRDEQATNSPNSPLSGDYERNRSKKHPDRERYYKLGLTGGLIIPSKSNVREIYGNFFSFGINFEEHGYAGGNNIGVVARYEAEYYHKTGTPKVYGNYPIENASAKITGIPLTGNIGIISRRNKSHPYLLGGIGYYIIMEELTIEYYDDFGNFTTETFSNTLNYLGYQIIFGNVVGNFFAEIKYSIVKFSLSTEESVLEPDFSGFRISLGIQF
jgi:hypothetical protein